MSSARGRGFTLVEMLITIAVIGVLAAVVLLVGVRVKDTGRARATEQTLRILDATVEEWTTSKAGAPVPAEYTDGRGQSFPMIDARTLRVPPVGVGSRGVVLQGNATAWPFTRPAEPSTQLYMALLRDQSPAAFKLAQTIDPAVTVNTYIETAWGFPQRDANDTSTDPADGVAKGLKAPQILDGWGEPIRMVHPAFHGSYGPLFVPSGNGFASAAGAQAADREVAAGRAVLVPQVTLGNFDTRGRLAIQFSRSPQPFDPNSVPGGLGFGDADGGKCPGGRPYFYSVGPDRNPGTRDDNVYTTRPIFQAETRTTTN